MTDDLERNLDDLYRSLDPAARRLEKRWQPQTRRLAPVRRGSPAPWIAAGVAAAAVIAIILVARMNEPKPAAVVRTETPKKIELPEPDPIRPLPRPEPKPEEPRPEPFDRPDVVGPPQGKPVVPEPKPEPKPEPQPEPKTEPRPAPKPTETEPAVAVVLPETEGTFELGGRRLSGKQKAVKILAGDRLKATTATKLHLADDRFVLLAPKAQVAFAPGERLVITIDSGDVLAEFVGVGPAVRFATKACEIDHVGTVFSMRVDEKRTVVAVEEGRVECRTSKGAVTLGPGQQATAAVDVAPATGVIDPRLFAWTRGQRPAERVRYSEDFATSGGVAKGVPDPDWCASSVRIETEKPLFHVPLKGRMTVVCRADRAATLIVQIHCADPKLNFRKEVAITRANAWQTITVEFDEVVPTDKSVKAKLPAGAAITEIYLMYGEAGEKATLTVDSITVTETR